jgi:hypothetical protein
MPAGEDVTVPVPVPALVTVRVGVVMKVAVTDRAALIVTRHVPVPAQSPDQPEKLEAPAGLAVSVTAVSAT